MENKRRQQSSRQRTDIDNGTDPSLLINHILELLPKAEQEPSPKNTPT